MLRSPWIKHGFWNTLEHGITSVADAASALALVYVFSSETFSRIALAQAFVASCLLLFFSPETILTRELVAWKKQGAGALRALLRVLRRFGWTKWLVALGVSAVVAMSRFGSGGEAWTHFWALVWAFSVVLMPQVGGADREFLRRELRLKELTAITLYRKLGFAVGTVAVAFAWPERLDLLAAVACIVLITSAVLMQWRAEKWIVRGLGGDSSPTTSVSTREILKLSFNSYSIWVHIAASLATWVQTMDLFFLGVFLGVGREAGLYAVVLKLANFSTVLPIALANGASLWVSRRDVHDATLERRKLRGFSAWFIAAIALQAVALWIASPYILDFLSHGRWTSGEQATMSGWFAWILIGTALASATQIARMWLQLRADMHAICLRVHIPWAAASVLIYGVAAYAWSFPGAAAANILSGTVLVVMVALAYRSLPAVQT